MGLLVACALLAGWVALGATQAHATAAAVAATAQISAPTASAAAPAATEATCPATRWIESWEAAPSDDLSVTDARGHAFVHGAEQTLRMVITPHYGGSLIRVRLSNAYGSEPITINATSIAQDQAPTDETSAALVPDTSSAVLFNGQAAVTIPAGGSVVSDPTSFTFSAFQNIAVSMYLASNGQVPTEHFTGRQISFGTLPGAGNQVDDSSGELFTESTTARYILSGLDVQAPGDAGTVVAFGDSITDGFQGTQTLIPEVTSTLNLNARWPDFLQKRIEAAGLNLSVANAGISGNRILQNGQIPEFGDSGLSRFKQDALDVPGVTTIIILEGANDIGQSSATPAEIEGGLTTMVNEAKAAGIHVLLGTLTPMGSAQGAEASYATAQSNATRVAVNQWIETSGVADGYIDFASAVADPSETSIINPPYNGGDGLHYDPAGYQALGNAVNLSQLQGPECLMPGLKLTVTPQRLTAHRRTMIRVRATITSAGQKLPAAGVIVRIARHRLRTNARGVATLILTPARAQRLMATASRAGYVTARVPITVHPTAAHATRRTRTTPHRGGARS